MAAAGLEALEADLNGQPALLLRRDGLPYAALLVVPKAGRIHQIFIQADAKRLGHIGPLSPNTPN